MVYNNGKYWISSSSSSTGKGIIYAVNSSGVQVDMVDFDLPWIRESQGLAFDGTDFWYVERKTARCDLYKVSNTGIVIDSIPTAELFGSNKYSILVVQPGMVMGFGFLFIHRMQVQLYIKLMLLQERLLIQFLLLVCNHRELQLKVTLCFM